MNDLMRELVEWWENDYPLAMYAGNADDHTLDMAMPEDQVVDTSALLAVVWSSVTDRRRHYFQSFRGSWCGATREWDFTDIQTRDAPNHYAWHVSIQIRPEYMNDSWAYEAIASALMGESSREWMNRPVGYRLLSGGR